MLKVYHSKEWALNSELHFVNSKDFCEKFHPYWVDGYKPMASNYKVVALVDTDDLERAFMLTNHIETAWQENEGVKAKVENCRSTSVGDLMEDEKGNLFMVAGCGFEKVEWYMGTFKMVESRGGKYAVPMTDEENKALLELQELKNKMEEALDRYEYAKKALKKIGLLPAVA